MGFKSPEVHETQLLESPGGSPEKKSRKDSFPWLQSKDSQCSLDKAHQHGWKPLTVSAAVLFSFAFASFILAVIIEILAQQSQQRGGLALSPTASDIPTYAKFGYLFLPTIVAVVYSLLWSWIDLDVKRIQPWLEMSRSGGATAMRSIFLDYPYDFVAFVPLRAARRRHWAVFYSGTVMVMIFWLITPLQSAILGSGTVDVRKPATVYSSEALIPGSEQIYTMDQSILNEGYAVTWLNQPLPPYTTSEYTLLPFTVGSDRVQASSTNWTGSTVKYWTKLECWPANVFPDKPGYHFLDGRGCNASDITPYGAVPRKGQPYKMQYIGYHASDWADVWLSITCSKSAAHQFLAIWARKEKSEFEEDVAAAFCETSYFKQTVNVSVSADNQTPLDGTLIPTGPREQLKEAEFNISSFEHLLGAGVSPIEINVYRKREHPFNHLLEQHHQIKNFGITWPSSPLVGFAVGHAVKYHNLTTLDSFQNETFMGETFNATHKLLFSLALRRMLNTSGTTMTDGLIDYEQEGIIVSRLYSAIVEGLLVVVGIFSILLWFHGRRAPSQLAMDPASLGSLLSICQNSPALLDTFAGKDCLSDKKLLGSFEDKRFHLVCGCQTRSGQTVIKVVDTRADYIKSQRISIPEPEMDFSMGHYSPVKPLALRREIGAAVILVMVGVMIGLSYLKMEERRIGGLIRPTNNFEVLQILENFIPTVFATLLEPFWVLVNRLLCILQPFKDLWAGQRPAKGSINARYTSVPPQFVLWRAAKSGHLVLVAICLLALLSNLLAVGLGGLFNERSVFVDLPCELQQTMRASFNNDSVASDESQRMFTVSTVAYEMPFYIIMNNISQGTPLPPWISKGYFFQPFSPVPGQGDKSDTYTARTRGFGVLPSCYPLETIRSTGFAPVINYTFTRDGQTIPECRMSYQQDLMSLNRSNFPNDPTGPCSAETITMMNPLPQYDLCDVPLLLFWSRTPDIWKLLDAEMETWPVICEPIFTTAMFDVTVDLEGYVLNATQASEPSSTLDGEPLSRNNTDMISTYVNSILFGPRAGYWHNDSFSQDFANYLLKIQPGTADLLDPLVRPNTTAIIPALEYLYQQTFAMVLGLNRQFFNNHTSPATITGVRRATEVRIFMDSTALAISLVVLGLNVAVAVALYGCTIRHFLPRMPTTIGSILAYVAPSRAVREYDGPGGLPGATFSFGRYVGDDGRAHVGIEMDPFVVPVKLSALRKGDTEPRTGLVRRILGRRRPARGDTWL